MAGLALSWRVAWGPDEKCRVYINRKKDHGTLPPYLPVINYKLSHNKIINHTVHTDVFPQEHYKTFQTLRQTDKHGHVHKALYAI